MMLSSGQHGGGGGRRLFTASQWQELEHQALIYKYMASGAPVPHDLVVPLRLATGVDTAPSLAFPPPQATTTSPTLGYWGCYGAGAQFGRKVEDPEPGRCRRTDGKKWRCAREAHGESKYCEKHIHRGKSRSRKPVEAAAAAASPAATSPAAGAAYRPSALSISPPRSVADSNFGLHHHQPQQYLHHGAAASARTTSAAGGAFQLQLDGTGLHAASPPPSYHRYAHYTTPAPTLYPGYGYGHGGHGQAKELQDAELRRRHYLALGADLSLDKPPAAAAAGGAEEKPLRRFFDDWPREGGEVRPPWAAEDATQLSISIPAASPSDLAAAAAAGRYHNGE